MQRRQLSYGFQLPRNLATQFLNSRAVASCSLKLTEPRNAANLAARRLTPDDGPRCASPIGADNRRA